jgi:hypothetical protein
MSAPDDAFSRTVDPDTGTKQVGLDQFEEEEQAEEGSS